MKTARVFHARGFLAVVAAIALAVLAGCATAPRSQVSELRRAVPHPKIVLMPLDVELSELGVGGLAEPKSEWTQRASQLLVEGLRSEERRMGFDMLEYADVKAEGIDAETLEQINRLHGVVGKSIMLNRFVKLPNKGERFDWTLGSDVRLLKQKTGADYALFVFVRDSYASDARKVAMVAGALIGVGMTGGQQLGFASLVDLDTGNVVWFNQLSRGTGDLRSPEPAVETIKVLLEGFPK